MKYIDADKLRAEIAKRIGKYDNILCDWDEPEIEGRRKEAVAILTFLDTLEAETSYDIQQYTPSPFVDIGDIARVQFASHAKVFDKKRKAVFDWEQFKEVTSIFYGFGKRDMKEQMMAGAVEVEVVGEKHDLRLIDSTQRCLFDAKRGDWLKIIIVKEGEK